MGIWQNLKAKYGRTDFEGPGLNVESANVERSDQILKSHIPNFLYRPPYGYPRPIELPKIRDLGKNSYVFSVVQTITDELASTDWAIKVKETHKDKVSEEDLKCVDDWFYNPNPENESFNQLLKKAATDVLEVDAGVWVKVFDRMGNFKSIYARDGGTFLQNPDVWGSIANRTDYVMPVNLGQFNDLKDQEQRKMYDSYFGDEAAWYQYGWAVGSYPIPFGKREIVYMMRNPRTDSIYGRAPLEILQDVLYTLIYGANYNLDFYVNNNMPEGVFQLLGANQENVKQFRERMEQQVRKKDIFGNMRKQAFKYPVVNAEAKFLPFQMKPLDMAIVEQQQWFVKLFWACFGITPSEMGFTEDSNRATEHGQNVVVKRKVLKPLLQLIEYNINTQIIPEFGIEGIEFKFDDYDLEEDIKENQLHQMHISMGVKTPEMVAEELGVDVVRLKKEKEENQERQMELATAGNPPQEGNEKKEAEESKGEEKKPKKEEVKAKPRDPDAFDDIQDYIKDVGNKLVDALDHTKNPINSV